MLATSSAKGERHDETSLLTLYRRLIQLRSSQPALLQGAYRFVACTIDTFVFERELEGERWLVAANFGAAPTLAPTPIGQDFGSIALSTRLDREGEVCRGREIELRPNEAVLVRVA